MELLQIIPVDKLCESSTNPRRTFRKMEDLTQSVKENGVLVPLLVRLTAERYEIIAGARRYRAALAAELRDVPAIVKDVTDEQALEIQVLENLQREDVHPLEEALGYRALLERTGYDVSAIAAKVGKSETYIYQRMKLTDLIDSVRDAFYEDRITISHAILIARLQPQDQTEALNYIFEEDYADAGRVCSAKELAGWIDNEIHLDLKKAPFKLIDSDLLPEAGSCINCHKRTGFIPQLFPDIAKKDTCTDGNCYQKKLQAHIDREIAKANKKDKELALVSSSFHAENKSVLPADKYHQINGKEDRCESAHKAIVVDGHSDRGKTIDICTNPDCPVHGKSSQPPAEESAWQKEQRLQEEKRKKERAIRKALYEEICSRLGKPKDVLEEKRMIALTLVELVERCHSDALNILGKGTKEITIAQAIKNQIPAFSEDSLDETILKLCLCRHIPVSNWGDPERPEMLTKMAELFDVDVKAIEKKAASDLRKNKKPSPGKTKSRKAETNSTKSDTPANDAPCVNTDTTECAEDPHPED